MSIITGSYKRIKVFACALAAVIILCSACAACVQVITGNDGCARPAAAAEIPEDWRLILVNGSHSIPEGYEITLTELSNGQSVDSRIYPDLQKMFDDARADGLGLTVREGYRTHQEQKDIMAQRIRQYRDQGYSAAKARSMAAELVAKPGTSEHELGLAVDINAVGDTDQWELYGWLARYSWKYGFILRYPPDREDITGITYEPWHYRYVGQDAAREIYERDITLEEYLG